MKSIESIIQTILNVTNTELDNIDFHKLLSPEIINHDESYQFLSLPSGNAHYKLLAFIASQFSNSVLFDIGTNLCRSAIALSTNPSNKVISYDVEQLLDQNPISENIEFLLGDSTKDKRLQESPFIMIDVNHDGLYEDIFYKHLHDISWRGILFIDDIHLNEPMRKFWNNITETKYDITSVGAWSGTGLAVFK